MAKGEGRALVARVRYGHARSPIPRLLGWTLIGLGMPALFLFTLLFRGQADRWRRSRAAGEPNPFIRAMWPALPMAVLAVGVAWLVQTQDLLVPTMTDGGQGVVPNAELILARTANLPRTTTQAALGYPLILLVLFTLGALALQWTFLDRIAVRRSRRDAN